jgi:hypothetical protein
VPFLFVAGANMEADASAEVVHEEVSASIGYYSLTCKAQDTLTDDNNI